MKATEAKLLQILGPVSQFIIPIKQYAYSWTPKECQQLWAEILRAAATEEMGFATSVSPPAHAGDQTRSSC